MEARAQDRLAEVADVDLRSAPGILDARAAWASRSRYREMARQAGGVREADGLHAYRAAAHHGASVLRVVGLPGDRLLRAHLALRHAGRFHVLRRPLPPGGHRRDRRLGAGALSRRTRTAWSSSTAPRSTSTPTRARASIATGAR